MAAYYNLSIDFRASYVFCCIDTLKHNHQDFYICRGVKMHILIKKNKKKMKKTQIKKSFGSTKKTIKKIDDMEKIIK